MGTSTLLPEPKKERYDASTETCHLLLCSLPCGKSILFLCCWLFWNVQPYSGVTQATIAIIHYIMMKLKFVPVDLACTQMQQSWHKPRPTEIQPVSVMNVSFCKAKQSEAKKILSHVPFMKHVQSAYRNIAMTSSSA